jgi:hypothetical protein
MAAVAYFRHLLKGSKGGGMMRFGVLGGTGGWWGRGGRGDAAPSNRSFYQPGALQDKATDLVQLFCGKCPGGFAASTAILFMCQGRNPSIASNEAN